MEEECEGLQKQVSSLFFHPISDTLIVTDILLSVVARSRHYFSDSQLVFCWLPLFFQQFVIKGRVFALRLCSFTVLYLFCVSRLKLTVDLTNQITHFLVKLHSLILSFGYFPDFPFLFKPRF